MKTDSLFYELFKTLPGSFFEVIGRSADAAEGYHFASVEIKQPNFRLDGVFRPSKDSPEKPVYFVEVQFQLDRSFYWRFFAEIFLFLRQEKTESNWQAAALFARRSLDPGIPRPYEAVAREHLTVIYLDEMGESEEVSAGLGIVQLIVAPPERAVEKVKQLSRKLHQEPGSGGTNRQIIELMEEIVLYKFPLMRREELENMIPLDDLRHTRVIQDALEEGKMEGKREGKREGKLEMVPLLLALGLSVEKIAEELGVDVAEVRKAAATG